jgi:cytochrome c oxidase subunit 3
MPVVTEEVESSEKQEDLFDFGGTPPPIWRPGDGGSGDSGESEFAFPVSKNRLGLWLALTAISMLFAGLSSAYIVMRGAPAWQNVALPSILWINTFLLLASSLTIEGARRHIRDGRTLPGKMWMTVTGALGLLFLIGQVIAWRQLVAVGVYLPTTLHSSFLYVLTSAHALHILGGLVALGYVIRRILQEPSGVSSYESVSLCATYWHFMDGLWVYLFLLLVLA